MALTKISLVKITIKTELGNFVPELPSLMIFQGQLFCVSLRFLLSLY